MQLKLLLLELGGVKTSQHLMAFLRCHYDVITVAQRFVTPFPNEESGLVLDAYERMLEAVLPHEPNIILALGGPHGEHTIPGLGTRVYAHDAMTVGASVYLWNALSDVPLLYVANDPEHLPHMVDTIRRPDVVLSQTKRDACTYAATQTWRLAHPGNEISSDPIRGLVQTWALNGHPGSPGPSLGPFKPWGPIFPHWEGWASSGLVQEVLAGRVPRVYGAGGFLTYDPDFLYVDADSTLRWNPLHPYVEPTAKDLARAVELAQPDFSILKQVIDERI